MVLRRWYLALVSVFCLLHFVIPAAAVGDGGGHCLSRVLFHDQRVPYHPFGSFPLSWSHVYYPLWLPLLKRLRTGCRNRNSTKRRGIFTKKETPSNLAALGCPRKQGQAGEKCRFTATCVCWVPFILGLVYTFLSFFCFVSAGVTRDIFFFLIFCLYRHHFFVHLVDSDATGCGP